MSAEEDADLRDLVAHTLENNGVLGKIKAELRAKVFMVLDAHDRNEANQLPVVNEKLQNFMNTKEGRLVTGLVREFMEFFELEYSLAVFDPETNFGDRYRGRDNLAEELNLGNDKPKKSRESPESSPRSSSSGSRNNSPRVSRIPQRVKEKKGEKSDTKYPKKDLLSEKSPEEDPKPGYKGNTELSLSLNDDDILAELTQPRPGATKEKTDNGAKKDLLLDEDPSRPSKTGLSLGPDSNLGSLKGGSLLSGPKELSISSPSPHLEDLAEIDRRINELGYGLPAEDQSPSHGDDYNDSYADDFHPSTHSNDENSSIPEEIDGDPLSIGSCRSEGSKVDDLITSDRTVSPDDYNDIDYREAVAKFSPS